METIIMHPDSEEQLSALKAFAKALKVKFETTKGSYNADFVTKIKESTRQVKDGKFTTIDSSKSIWENLE